MQVGKHELLGGAGGLQLGGIGSQGRRSKGWERAECLGG